VLAALEVREQQTPSPDRVLPMQQAARHWLSVPQPTEPLVMPIPETELAEHPQTHQRAAQVLPVVLASSFF